MKRFAAHFALPLETTGLLGLLEGLERNPHRLRVLTYHRVAEPDATSELEPGLISASPAAFRAEMELLAERYRPISLRRLLAVQARGEALPERAVLVTFDDGYRDFADHAWPVLRALGIPVVLFVPTAFPDGDTRGFWWDRLHSSLMRTRLDRIDVAPFGSIALDSEDLRRSAYKRIRTYVKSIRHADAMAWLDAFVDRLAAPPSSSHVLGWQALRTLAAQGVDVCSHGHAHALMTRLDPADLANDLAESRDRIRQEIPGSTPPVLAYPSNAHGAVVRAAAARAGYALAFGGARGINAVPLRDPLQIKRVPVMRYHRALFRAQLRPSFCAAGRAFSTIRERLRA